MTQLIKTTSLMGFHELVTQLQGDADALLCQFNIEPEKVKKLEGVLPFCDTVNLIETAAQRLNCPDFGLRLAQRQDLSVLGTLATAALNAPTIGDAVKTISHHLHCYTGGFRICLDRDEKMGHGYLSFETSDGQSLPPQTAELIMGLAHRCLTELRKNGSPPLAVWRTSPIPLHNSYRKFFSAPVSFSRLRDTLVLSAELLENKIEHSNPKYQHLYGVLQDTPMDMDLKHQVEQLIYRLLPIQRCNLQEVANRLGLHKRTLQRRLAKHSIVFEDLLDDIRRKHADRYLADPNLPMVQIAAQLGYREQSSFNRACRRWFGTTPLKRRQILRKGQREKSGKTAAKLEPKVKKKSPD